MRTQRDDVLTPVVSYKSQQSPESVMRKKERKERADDNAESLFVVVNLNQDRSGG